MTSRPGIIERAYQIARSGDAASVTAIKARLRAEGYVAVESYIGGHGLTVALRRACQEAHKAAQLQAPESSAA